MYVIFSFLINVLAVIVTSYALSGVHIKNFSTAVIVAIVFAIINTLLRPLLFILTLPINILTLGLFSFVIMGLLVYLVTAIVPGFTVDSFWTAILFALFVGVINALLHPFTRRRI